MFFRTKSEKTKDKAVARAKGAGDAAVAAGSKAGDSIKLTAASLLHSVSEAVSPRAEAAAETVRDRSAEARNRAARGRKRAVAGLDKGIDSAVPRAQEGVAHVAPKVDQARDAIVEDLLPKIQELIGSIQSGKNDLLRKQDGVVAAVTGAPKRQSRKGGVLLSVGLLAAIGAAVAYFLSQKSDNDDTDPWAAASDPSGERPIGGAPGVDSQVRETLGTTTTPNGSAAPATDPAPSFAAAEPADPFAASTTAPVATGLETEPAPRMLSDDDVPGTDPDARTGFGTDFGEDEQEKPHS